MILIWGFPKIRVPQNGSGKSTMDNDLGGTPMTQETPISNNQVSLVNNRLTGLTHTQCMTQCKTVGESDVHRLDC